MPSDSEDDVLNELEDDLEENDEQDIDDELLNTVADDAITEEGDEASDAEDSDEEEDEDDDEDESEPSGDAPMDVDAPIAPSNATSQTITASQPSDPSSPKPAVVVPLEHTLTPAQERRKGLLFSPGSRPLKTFTVEAICAIPHPVPTHALAASQCMSHLLTGSDDGYIRDYDVFTALNSKNFLTAPQRHHAGVVEGLMKAGQLRFWWENPSQLDPSKPVPAEEETPLAPVFSLAMHSDALWALAGSSTGHINLFTVRHQPGQLCHVINAHRSNVSALCLSHDEKGCFSAGWDGDAIHWDLNTGQRIRKFTAQGAQLAAIALRPENALHAPVPAPNTDAESPSLQTNGGNSTNEVISDPQPPQDSDARSDASFDPLFDDEPESLTTSHPSATEASHPASMPGISNLAMPNGQSHPLHRPSISSAPPKNLPNVLDSLTYATYSPDILLTAAIDGQVILWDKRNYTPGKGVGRLWFSDKTPPWCLSACWSADGTQVYAGRRNGTVDVWDVRQLGRTGPGSTPRLLKTLRNPASSGVVSCVVAFPDNRHIATASIDNLRLWNVAEATEADASGKTKNALQFKIIPGHHGGYISQMLVDPGARFLVSASSNRGWHGESTRTVFVHDIKRIR